MLTMLRNPGVMGDSDRPPPQIPRPSWGPPSPQAWRSPEVEMTHGTPPRNKYTRKAPTPVRFAVGGPWALRECEDHTTWVNETLRKANIPQITDLRRAVADGVTLVKLLGALDLPPVPGSEISGRSSLARSEAVVNLYRCLSYLADRQVDTRGLDAEDLANGDLRSTLILVSNIRKKYDSGYGSRSDGDGGVSSPGKERCPSPGPQMPGRVIVDVGKTPARGTPQAARKDKPLPSQRRSAFGAPSPSPIIPGVIGGQEEADHRPPTAPTIVSRTEVGSNGVSQFGVEERRQFMSGGNPFQPPQSPDRRSSNWVQDRPPTTVNNAWGTEHLHNQVESQRPGTVEDRLRHLIDNNRSNVARHAPNHEEGELLVPPSPTPRNYDDTVNSGYYRGSYPIAHPGQRHPGQLAGYVPSKPSERRELKARVDSIIENSNAKLPPPYPKPQPSPRQQPYDNPGYTADDRDGKPSVPSSPRPQPQKVGPKGDDLRSAWNRLYGAPEWRPAANQPHSPSPGPNQANSYYGVFTFEQQQNEQHQNQQEFNNHQQYIQNQQQFHQQQQLKQQHNHHPQPPQNHQQQRTPQQDRRQFQTTSVNHQRQGSSDQLRHQRQSSTERHEPPHHQRQGSGHQLGTPLRISPTGQSSSTQGQQSGSASSSYSGKNAGFSTFKPEDEDEEDAPVNSADQSPLSDQALAPSAQYPEAPGSRPSSARTGQRSRPDSRGVDDLGRRVDHNYRSQKDNSARTIVQGDRPDHVNVFARLKQVQDRYTPPPKSPRTSRAHHPQVDPQPKVHPSRLSESNRSPHVNQGFVDSDNESGQFHLGASESIFDYVSESSSRSVTPPLPPLSPNSTPRGNPEQLSKYSRSYSTSNVSPPKTPDLLSSMAKPDKKTLRGSSSQIDMAGSGKHNHKAPRVNHTPRQHHKPRTNLTRIQARSLEDLRESESNLSFDVENTLLMVEPESEQFSEMDSVAVRDTRALRQQLQGLESAYQHVLKRGGQGTGARRRRWSIGSSDTSSINRGRKFRSSASHRSHSRDIKAIQRRFQKLESHVVTLARSVAHLSSEMRTHNSLSHEMETVKREMRELRLNQHKHNVMGTGAGNNMNDFEKFRGWIPSLTNPKRVNKLTKFFGQEPPLLELFLQKLGYERYAKNFATEHIGMIELPYMTEDRLQSIGIPMGPRLRILQEAQLCFRQENFNIYIV